MNVDKIRALIKKNQIYDGDVILFKARKAALEVIESDGNEEETLAIFAGYIHRNRLNREDIISRDVYEWEAEYDGPKADLHEYCALFYENAYVLNAFFRSYIEQIADRA